MQYMKDSRLERTDNSRITDNISDPNNEITKVKKISFLLKQTDIYLLTVGYNT